MKRVLRAVALASLSTILPAPAEQAAERHEKIEVTGSRIINSDVESPSPIAVIDAREVRAEGYQSLELILNNFPQFVGSDGVRVSNGASGTATANLRGLFDIRTLVLLNGRRLHAGGPGLAPDLNQIPVPLISRVEILTGGASAVYGSDAIAGVVNFILTDRFEGVQGDISHDFHGHRQKSFVAELLRARNIEVPGDKAHDGATTTASLTAGRNFAQGKGNLTAFLRYMKVEKLLQTERDYSACALSANAAAFFCGGSTASYPGRFLDVESGRDWTLDGQGGVRRFNRQTDLFNFGPWNYYQRPVDRYGFNAFGDYEFSPRAKLYGEFGYHDDRTVAQLAPSGLFGTFLVPVRYENPLLTDAWRSRLVFMTPEGEVGTGPGTIAQLVILRRNIEGGGRQADLKHDSSRGVVGVKGSIGSSWDYDVSFQAARVSFEDRFSHDFSNTRIARALDVVRDPATGAAVCASVLNGTDRACVPYNVWVLGGVSEAARTYVEADARESASTSQRVVSASATGDLGAYGIRVPGSSLGVEIAFGAERRKDSLSYEPDEFFASGDLAGFTAPVPPVHGSISVTDLFVEARIPLRDDLKVTGSYRRSDYSIAKKTDSFGVGFNASPSRFARLRGSFQRAVRAPNVNELFTPQSQSGWLFPNFAGDPCAGANPTRSLSDCQRTGVTAAQYGHIDDTPGGNVGYIATFGGNPDLSPETANTRTFGVVLTPVKDLTASVDFFDIRVDEFIFAGTPEVTFQRCIDTGDPLFCQLIRRDPRFGTLWLPPANVLATNQNIGRVRVVGTDVSLNYRHRLPGGHELLLDGMGTYLRRYSYEPYRGAEARQCVGVFFAGCFEARPEWRHRLRTAWRTPWKLEAAATWRYIGRTANPDSVTVSREIRAMNYLDLAASWSIDRRFTMRVGINNVQDRDPPLISGGAFVVNGNTFVNTYDALGRHVSVSVTAKY